MEKEETNKLKETSREKCTYLYGNTYCQIKRNYLLHGHPECKTCKAWKSEEEDIQTARVLLEGI